MLKKLISLLMALVCLLSFNTTVFATQSEGITTTPEATTKSVLRGAYDPYVPGGTPIIEYVDVWPVTYRDGIYTEYPRHVQCFSWEQSNPKFGSVTGTYTLPDNLINVVGLKVFIGWRFPENYVYIDDPTNGFHRSNYMQEDVHRIYFKDCNGNMHIEVLNSNYSTYIDIKVPYMS